jgi:hypothetical protein
MLEGFPINGLFHARRLCLFIPRDSTALASLQEALAEDIAEEDLPNIWEQELDIDTQEASIESESEQSEGEEISGE